MAFRPPDPKSGASASSATFARRGTLDLGYQGTASSQKLCQLFDPTLASHPRRGIPAGACAPAGLKILEIAHQVHAIVSIALHRDQFITRA